MKRILLIGLKDMRLAFRDTAALILMLAAPFALAVGLGLATGSFGSQSSGISDIPVVLVDQDGGALGAALLDLFASPELADLLEPQELSNPLAARQQVDDDLVAAAVIIPPGFSDSIIPPQPGQPASNASAAPQLELYTNPNMPNSAGIVQTIVEQFLSRLETGRVGGEVVVTQLLSQGLIGVQEVAAYGQASGQRQAELPSVLGLQASESESESVRFNPLAILAPSMALMFLMYTVAYGGRSILIERSLGTLPRLLVSPTSTVEVLGGKVLGIFLTGSAQMLILVIGCALLFRLEWGDPLGVLALVLAAVFGATGWGMLLTALARTPNQVASLGSALMLTFGILGGNFINLEYLPAPIQWISKLTPNAWGLDGFTTLALGGGLPELATPILALLAMGIVLFAVAVLLFNRNAILK
jgi:ABC-2 type transport system permease protein